jgi:hypothetical protein
VRRVCNMSQRKIYEMKLELRAHGDEAGWVSDGHVHQSTPGGRAACLRTDASVDASSTRDPQL